MAKEVIFITTKYNNTGEQERVELALNNASVPFMKVNADNGYHILPQCSGKPAVCVRDSATKECFFMDHWTPSSPIDDVAAIAAYNA